MSNYIPFEWCCENLQTRVQDSTHHKGFVPIIVKDDNTKETTFLGIAYKTSAKGSGLMLSYCPWCQKSIRPTEKEIIAIKQEEVKIHG